MKYIPGIFKIKSTHPVTLLIIGVMAAAALAIFIWADLISAGPYKMTQVKRRAAGGLVSGYYDLDHDGVSEFLNIKRYPAGFPAVEIFKGRNQFIEAIRPKGEWFNIQPSFCFGDFDQDSLSELYLFTTSNDSIFLNAYEPLGDDSHFIRDLFIDNCNILDGKNDLLLTNTEFTDTNEDGYEEMTFLIKAGFSKYPRRMYSLDIRTGELAKGINNAAGYTVFFPVDLDGDKRKDFVAVACALENFDMDDTTVLYNDNSAWLLGFSNDLKEVMLELEFPDQKPHIQSCMYGLDNEEMIIVKLYEQNTKQQYILKYNLAGELIQKENLNYERNLVMLNASNPGLPYLVFSDMQNLFVYDDKLKLVKEIDGVGIPEGRKDDFGFSSLTGFYIFNNQEEVFLLNSEMEEIARTLISDIHINNRFTVSVVSIDSDNSFTFAMTNSSDGEFIYQVNKRRVGNIGIFINILMFLGFYTLFGLVFRVQYYLYRRMLSSEQKIQSLQLQTVQNQLQPHFTFNVLNTIGSLIYKDDKEAAYEYLNYFSDMLRSALVSGNQTDWMLDEEIRFIEAYVTMENMRFDNKFSFSLDVSSETDISFRIPKLMVQTYVENAISHGLMHKKDDCTLNVNIGTDDSHIVISVEDNGIGRLASEKLQKDNGGHGNEILNKYMELYNRINKTKFVFTVTDLFNGEGKAGGTKVALWIPKDYSKIISLR